MQSKARDPSLDVLKGLGCLLMIMAHAAFKTGIYRQLTFLGGFAPVPFYAVVGVTAAFQAQKYGPRPVLLNALFLFLLGFALNGFNSPDFLRPPVIHFDIIQIIAIGSLAVYLLEYYFKPPVWLYLFLGIMSFLIKLGLDVVLPAKSHPLLAGILLTYSGTFPIFPWIFLFFLGVFAYRLGTAWDLGWALVSAALYAGLALTGFDLDYRSKYDMSVGYFLLSGALLFGLFFLVRRFEALRRPSRFNPILFFGQNSLLFLFVHFAAIAFFGLRLQWTDDVHLFRAYPFLFWLFIFLFVWALMALLVTAAKTPWLESLFDRLWVWVFLTALVLAVLLVPHNGFVRWAEAGLGMIAGLYYHRLGRALKGVQAPSPD
jgi:heparan-alpha-glucosaminide N-acetyltransferase-like protein